MAMTCLFIFHLKMAISTFGFLVSSLNQIKSIINTEKISKLVVELNI